MTCALVVKRVYPRACGGTGCQHCLAPFAKGLSPRLRGNAHDDLAACSGNGSIPALAGERLRDHPAARRLEVYPRACGGTAVIAEAVDLVVGLSPRLRGNDQQLVNDQQQNGSIPALAGERFIIGTAGSRAGVYPRACGGTMIRARNRDDLRGLSPRLRGNVLHSTI